MGWAGKLLWCLAVGGALAGCAGSAHELPAITEAESRQALQEINAAPTLIQTARTAHENEVIARRVLIRLQAKAQPICDSTGRRTCWHTLQFSPKGEVNAGVLENRIIFYNGLAQFLDTDDEFAAILAHEMGHNISGHYDKKAQNQAVGATIAGLIFAGILGVTGSYSGAGTDLGNAMDLGGSIGRLSFSKEHEREADYVAAYLMTAADYNPEAARDVWVKITKANGQTKTELFDTHPGGPDRLAAWTKSIEEVRYSADLVPNLAGAGEEPRLQEARAFSNPSTTPDGGTSGTALALSGDWSGGSVGLGSGQALASGLGAAPQRPSGSWQGSGPRDGCGASWAINLVATGTNTKAR